MLADAADGEVGGQVVAVRQGDGVPRLDAQRFSQLFRHDDALLAQRDRLAGKPLVQVSKIGKLVHVGRHHQVDVHLALGAVLAGGFHRHGQRVDGVFLIIKVVVDGTALGGFLFGDDGHEIVVVDIAVLLGDDGVQRVGDAEARHQQRGTARHTDDGHPETLFVAQQVAAGDFPAEGQAAPQRGDALQQDALARLGCARQHKGGGVLLQGGAAGQRRDAHGKHNEGAARKQCLAQPPGRGDGGHIVHHLVRRPDDGRERLEPDRQPGHSARSSSRKGVEQVLLHDGGA